MRSDIQELGTQALPSSQAQLGPPWPLTIPVTGMWHQVLHPQCSAAGWAGTQWVPSRLDTVMVLPEQHAAVGALSRDQTFKAQKTPQPSSGSL